MVPNQFQGCQEDFLLDTLPLQQISLDDVTLSIEYDLDTAIHQEQLFQCLTKIITRYCKYPQREFWKLLMSVRSYYGELGDHQENANHMGIRYSTYRSHLHRIGEVMREQIKKHNWRPEDFS